MNFPIWQKWLVREMKEKSIHINNQGSKTFNNNHKALIKNNRQKERKENLLRAGVSS